MRRDRAVTNVRPALRREALRDALAHSAESLRRGRTDELPDGYIADYLALAWVHWSEGRLHLTASGEAVCRQLPAPVAA